MSRMYVFTRYGGPETEELQERPVPEPGPGQLLVEVRAAGVNPSDLKLREGVFGRRHTLPRTLGFEVSGVVAAVGPDVEGYAVGDAVLGPVAPGGGGFADHALVRAREAARKPDGVSFEAAATIPVAGTTAYDLVHQAGLEDGQTVLVLGAGGGVGHLACEIARAGGARVIGVASEGKRELVESTGATWVASGDGAADAVRELAPDGVDLLVDLVGGQPLRDLAPLVTSPDRIVSAADEETATALGGSGRVEDPEALARLVAMVGDGAITPEVSAVYPLERAGEALAAVARGHGTGKTVVVP